MGFLLPIIKLIAWTLGGFILFGICAFIKEMLEPKIGGFALNEFTYYNLDSSIDKKKYKTNPENVYGYGHIKFYEHFLKSMKSKKKSEFECDEAIKTVKLINAIYKSIELKKEIFMNSNITSKRLGN